MNLLIVDDEESAVLAVVQGVCWENLEFTGVYTASNMAEAKKIIEAQEIHVLLCDIEMPMGTGLELLEWVNDHRPGICCVFMTCHADFSFAQQAVHLGSFDYILKPLDFNNLEGVLKKAAMKAAQEAHLKKAGDYWEKGHKAAEKQFWRELFNGDIDANEESIRDYIRRNQLDIPVDGQFVPILICPRMLDETLSPEDKSLFNFALRNVTEEVFRMKVAVHELEPLAEDRILIMLRVCGGVTDTVLFDQIRQHCRTLMDAASRYLHIKICCYVGNKVSMGDIPGQIEQLYRLDFNNVVATEITIFMNAMGGFLQRFEYAQYITEHYRRYHGSYAAVVEEIGRTLERDRQLIVMDKDFMDQFFKGFYYMLSDFSEKHGVFMRDLVAAKHNRELLLKAEASMDGLVEWVKYMGMILGDWEHNHIGRQTPVALVKDYIKEHIDEELNVDTLAGQVHLNSDYLNRIFKKETGMTISKYTILQRMERAKWLLRHTDSPISEVAAAVGYFNYSSFNRSFSKIVGRSPQEYKFDK